MSIELFFGAVALAWIVIGLVLAVFMGRRGHEGCSWFVIGAVLGPLAIAPAISALRHRTGGGSRLLHRGTPGSGRTDVVVGVDGSAEARAAVRGVIELFGAALGRLTVVTVVPFDATHTTQQGAEKILVEAAKDAPECEVETTLLTGQPASELRRFATSGTYDVLALGTRGAGRARALLGSVASELARGSTVPVLLFSGPVRDDS
jgi:nucleotide-binding universal stress UspA family protein